MSIVANLPDDVVMDILRRMPALDVFNCRSVCRRWRDLITNQKFERMHLKTKACRSSMILIQKSNSIQGKGALLVLGKWGKPPKKPTVRKSRPNFIDNSGSGLINVKLSCDGLIVMLSTALPGYGNDACVYTILNPISGDTVRIETPWSFHVRAMFFNPSIEEYCLLFDSFNPLRGPNTLIGFEILNLGAQPCYRTLKQPVSITHLVRMCNCRRPVVIDNDAAVYWLVEGGYKLPCEEVIMAFDIKTESFSYMSHPHPIHNCQGLHREGEDIHIMKIDGSLSFVTIAHEGTLCIINIWTLKDSATRLWSKTYSVRTDISLVVPRLWTNLTNFSSFKVMGVDSGEVFLHYVGMYGGIYGGIYIYNLELGTLRRIIGKPYLNSTSNFDPEFFFFMPSCVSLRNCKSIIRISYDDY